MSDLQFVINSITGAQRKTGPDGRAYLVAPGVAIIAGVVGNELVTEQEIKRTTFGWGGRPLPLYHPMANGTYISANSPDLEASLSIGKFWNPHFADGKLRGEYWIDIEKATAMGGEALTILERLQANQAIETSTAYGRDFDPTPGTFNGKPYAGIARNLVPDHVAVLANVRGKCSIADGCGLLANSEAEGDCGCGCGGKKTAIETQGDRETGRQVEVNADVVEQQARTGIMIAFFLDTVAADALAMSADDLPDGSEPVATDQLHVTLNYLGKVGEVERDELSTMQAMAEFAKYAPAIRGRVGGIGRFSKESDGKHALWAQVDAPLLATWREQLMNMVGYGPKSEEHGFIPHITLAYVPADAPAALLPPPSQELLFNTVALSWGDRTTIYALQGEAMPSQAANSNSEDEMAEENTGATQAETPAAVNVDALIAVNGTLASVQDRLATYDTFFSTFGGVDKVIEKIKAVEVHAQAMAANAAREKDTLIDGLVANSRCLFGREELAKFDIEQLSKLQRSLQPVDYTGRGFAANQAAPAGVELVSLEELNEGAK